MLLSPSSPFNRGWRRAYRIARLQRHGINSFLSSRLQRELGTSRIKHLGFRTPRAKKHARSARVARAWLGSAADILCRAHPALSLHPRRACAAGKTIVRHLLEGSTFRGVVGESSKLDLAVVLPTQPTVAIFGAMSCPAALKLWSGWLDRSAARLGH